MSCSVGGHVEGEHAFCASEGGRQVHEYASYELELWEVLILQLAKLNV